jgi:glycosyltransferase involved in cell wall biosynthesis
MQKTKVSFVIPAKDEERSISILISGIEKVIKKITNNYEIIIIDDGSIDKTFDIVKNLTKKSRKIKLIRHRGNFGKSVALQNGFTLATGDFVFTMDADLQDDPKEIPNFIKKLNDGYDLVSGWKKIRHDPKLTKVIPSRIINWLASTLTGVAIHDTNCGYKIYRNEVVKNLNLYGELYRFIPIMAAKMRFTVGEIPVVHHQRKYGKSKFGWSRTIKGIIDLLTIVFLTGYIQRPGHFFGGIGFISFASGFVIGLYITYLRITTGGIAYRQPLLFLGVLLMILGIQMISTGLLAEMIIYSQKRQDYSTSIKEIIP